MNVNHITILLVFFFSIHALNCTISYSDSDSIVSFSIGPLSAESIQVNNIEQWVYDEQLFDL